MKLTARIVAPVMALFMAGAALAQEATLPVGVLPGTEDAVGMMAGLESPADVAAADVPAPSADPVPAEVSQQIVADALSADAITMSQAAEALAPRILTLPGVRAFKPVESTPGLWSITASREHLVSIDRLVARLNAVGADQAAEYDGFARMIATMMARTDPFKLETLRVIIRPASAIDAFETETAVDGVANRVVRRSFAYQLEEVVAGDTATSIALMPVGRLADLNLGKTQAFDRGRANIAALARNARWSEADGLLTAELDGSYEASLLAVDSIWRAMEQRLGGQVAVAVPTRSRLVIGRANRAADMGRLRAIARDEAKGPGRLTDRVLLRVAGSWASE